jgi:hypothetical protein
MKIFHLQPHHNPKITNTKNAPSASINQIPQRPRNQNAKEQQMQYIKPNSSMIEKMGAGALTGYIGASDVTEAEKSSNRVEGKSLLRESLAENKTSIEVTLPFQQKILRGKDGK